MPPRIDLTNKVFGRLTVIKQADNIQTPNGRSHVAWECLCECGNSIIVRGDNLRNGHTVSCGCKKREVLAAAGKNRASNLVGTVFGRLTVKADSGERDNKGGIIWECECSCGNCTASELFCKFRQKFLGRLSEQALLHRAGRRRWQYALGV